MDSPEPPQLDPDRVIRGAVTEVVLQSPGLPQVPFDRRRPQAYMAAVHDHHVRHVRPRVLEWTERNMTREVDAAMRDIVGRYNFVLARHAGERMVNMDFYPGRPPMDPYEAADHDVLLENDVARAVTLCDWEEVAELGGPSGSLDAVRSVYVRALRGIRDQLAGMFRPIGAEWLTPDAVVWRNIGQMQLLLAPFVYRCSEEFAALHLVQGAVSDLSTHDARGLPRLAERAERMLHVSDLERRQMLHSLQTVESRAKRVIEEYANHKASEAGRTGIGKFLWPSNFPAEECKELIRRFRTERCVQNARELVQRIHDHWQMSLRLGALPPDHDIAAAYGEVWRGLQDFRTLLNSLCSRMFDGYEGK